MADVSVPAAPGDPRFQRCGFAKLQGEGIEFFMRKYEVTMGRNSKNSTLDLILGESPTISRQHASIRYNFEGKQFELVVLGKNGVSVDHGDGNFHLYTPESPPTALKSRDLLMMGEKKFYFLLPRTLGSRKRRRTEASPAPAAVAPAAAPAPGAAAPAQPTGVAVPAAAPAAAPAGPVASQPEAAPQAAVVSAPQAAAAAAVAAHPGAAYPDQAPPAQQPSFQAPPPTQAAPQPPQPAAAAVVAAPPPPAQPEAAADEEEALINAGGPMQYDNGAEYGAGFGSGF